MPTGYTAGIIDGTIKDFNEYAKQCSRAFMIHLRDEPMNSEYQKREPSNYHFEEIEKSKLELNRLLLLTDVELVIQEKMKLLENREYHLLGKEKQEDNKEKLEGFLVKAMNYIPPTELHNGIADFMQSQLKTTIEFDCSGTYHIKALKTISDEMENMNPKNIRKKLQAEANKNIEYHTKERESELKRCKDTNKWYEDFINSLN